MIRTRSFTAPKARPGSAFFFECNLMHGSSGNLSPDSRTNLFIVDNSVNNAVVEPFGERPPRPESLAERTVVPL
jgi:ectoine hydroxylase